VSKVDIIPFENKHAEFILSQPLNSKFLELKAEHKKYAYFLKEIGMSFTGIVNNKPIAAGGVFPLWDGVAEGWVLATKEINNYPITFARVMKKRTDMMIANNLITFENVIGKLFISFVAKTHPSATPSQSGNTPPAAMGLLFNIPVNDIPISFR